MEFVDTHCHIHMTGYKLDPDQAIKEAQEAGVNNLICVGTSLEDSQKAVKFVEKRDYTWASIGIHPHESKDYENKPELLREFDDLTLVPKVIAIGECGLDYFYNYSPKSNQINILEHQLDLARKHNLPVIFHVRNAFEDFWPIFDNFPGIKGVIHSFTSEIDIMNQALSRGLYIGLNGIMTFTKDDAQKEMAKSVSLDKLLLETDAPYLTPSPFRGIICEPKHVRVTAEFLANLRGDTLAKLAEVTTDNAKGLFKFK